MSAVELLERDRAPLLPQHYSTAHRTGDDRTEEHGVRSSRTAALEVLAINHDPELGGGRDAGKVAHDRGNVHRRTKI